MKRINEIKLISEPDDYPSLDHLGEFSNEPKEGAIKHNGGLNSLKFFNPSNPEYGRQDYERMMQFERGEVYSMVFHLKAKIATSDDKKYWHESTILLSSGYGIESDSSDDMLQFLEKETDLFFLALSALRNLGFKQEEINLKLEEAKNNF